MDRKTKKNIFQVDVDCAKNALNNSDSYTFWQDFEEGRCMVKTGPTGTNVMDIQFILIDFETI